MRACVNDHGEFKHIHWGTCTSVVETLNNTSAFRRSRLAIVRDLRWYVKLNFIVKLKYIYIYCLFTIEFN
jgi:hypothetical protein